MFSLTYAHSIKYDPSKLDRAPHSAYVLKAVDAEMYRVAADPMVGEDESFSVHVNEKPIGWGCTKEEAINDAKYKLMNDSRKAAPVN